MTSSMQVLVARAAVGAALVAMGLVPVGAAVVGPRPLAVGGPPSGPSHIPTGQFVTATAAPGSRFYELGTGLRPDTNADAAEAVTTALSPDGSKLLVLTSGYNTNFFDAASGAPIVHSVLDPTTGQPTSVSTPNAEWVFVYDVSSGQPKKLQQINIPNTYDGLVWDPSGARFYVSGGIDDRVYIFKESGGSFVPDAPFVILGHNSNDTAPIPKYDGGLLKGTPAGIASGGALVTGADAAGLAVSGDGKTLAIANMENDSVSFADTSTRNVSEVKFFTPGQTIARGEYPYWTVMLSGAGGVASKAYVSSLRDDEVLAVVPGGSYKVIPVGSGPNRMLLSRRGRRLFVADGNDDSIAIVDTARDVVVGRIDLHPGDPFRGWNPNALALGPHGRRLYVTLGGANAVAVVDLEVRRTIGLIPTGWYPNSVTVANDGRYLYVVNAKSNVGPNPANTITTPAGIAANPTHRNDYNWAKEKAGLLVIPVPDSNELAYLTRVVSDNDEYYNRQDDATMAYLHTKIKHVIYIVKENRTYDQVLGDLPGANGDPQLTVFPQPITPNHHALASQFVTLDNFYDPGESSGVGWNWTMAGHTTDFVEKNQSVLYGNAGFNGLTYDYQGTNRNINLGAAQTGNSIVTTRETGLLDPSGQSSILPGYKDVAATENADDDAAGAVGGYIWDAALRAGKSVRDYGWQVDLGYYSLPGSSPLYPKLVRNPFAAGAVQSAPNNPVLAPRTDVYYRAFDQAYPDLFRLEEWEREFNGFVSKGNLPALEVMTLPHDHFGSFSTSIEGLNTPTLEIADDDYALGRLVQDVSNSPYWKDTAIFVLEDDSQNGPDHVDGHRSIGYVISAYTKRRAVVHTTYTTTNVLRTIEGLLGLVPLGMNDANSAPMSDVFVRTANLVPYQVTIPGVLCAAPVSPTYLPACSSSTAKKSAYVRDRHDGAWWVAQTKGFDFSGPDRIDANAFNRLLWRGVKGSAVPYPDDVAAIGVKR